MIESINIKKVASFDDAGITINDLKKINFIYGANGSGKTTITRLIDNPNEPRFVDSTLKWVSDSPIKPLVYNKDFRDRNFGKGEIDGVFTLGQATKEEVEKIQQMEAQLDKITEQITNKNGTLSKIKVDKQLLESEFKDSTWNALYKKYETSFKEAFTGVMNSKEAFKSKILTEFASNSSELRSYQNLIDRAKIIFGKKPTEIQPIGKPDFQRLHSIEKDDIWAKKIVGKADIDIAKLIQYLNINDWVNEGRKYLQNDEVCPFCQQNTISQTFRMQLDAYFDESFTNDINLVKAYADEYIRITTNIANVLNTIEINEKEKLESKLDLEKFSGYLKTALSLIISNKELISNKVKEPSRNISLLLLREQFNLISGVIDDANTLIEKHNNIVMNFVRERASLVNEIWRFLSIEYKDKIDLFTKRANGYTKGIDSLINQITQLQKDKSALQNQIREANKNITSIQPSIDEINRILNSFGFDNFKIVIANTEKNYYQIQREDGTLAVSTLSEGEITFITFLYFLQLTKGSIQQETVSEQRILVIDDPISSLDSTVLFVVSSLIKEIIKKIRFNETNIKQLIILTHNVYFHKEVSFIDGRTKENGETKFWIIRKIGMYSQIQDYGMKNPINSSYELLWKELQNNQDSGLTIQNTMRRIIENYFKILGKYGDDELINEFPNTSEKEICRSLISWINDGSHTIPDDLYIEQSDIAIEKYQDVFKRIFEQTGHIAHYNMMMGVN